MLMLWIGLMHRAIWPSCYVDIYFHIYKERLLEGVLKFTIAYIPILPQSFVPTFKFNIYALMGMDTYTWPLHLYFLIPPSPYLG